VVVLRCGGATVWWCYGVVVLRCGGATVWWCYGVNGTSAIIMGRSCPCL